MQSQISSGGVQGPVDYYVSVTGRSRDGYREHSAENTELLTANFGYKYATKGENRFYVTVDRKERLHPSGLTKEEMYANPRQTDPDAPSPGATPYAISQDYNKNWYYLRLADKVSVNKRAGAKLTQACSGGIATSRKRDRTTTKEPEASRISTRTTLGLP